MAAATPAVHPIAAPAEAPPHAVATLAALFGTMTTAMAYCRVEFVADEPVDILFLFANTAMHDVTGMADMSSVRLSALRPGMRFADASVLGFFVEVAITGQPQAREFYLARTQRWYMLAAHSPHQGHFICLATDITERKEQQAALGLQSAITENAPQGINLVTADGIIRYTNPRFDAMFGYSPGELLGQHIATINAAAATSPEATAEAILTTIAAQGEWRGELLNRRKNGSVLWTAAIVSRFEHPTLGTVLFTYQSDISDEKYAQVVRARNESQMRAIIEASPVPLALVDQLGNITFLNPCFTSTLGYTMADVATLGDWWPLAYPDPSYREWVIGVWLERIDAARRSGQLFEPLEVTLSCKDGSQRRVQAAAAPVGESFSRGYVVTLYDITDLAATRRDLRVLNDNLDLRVTERTKQLALALGLAEVAKRDRSEFLERVVADVQAAKLVADALAAERDPAMPSATSTKQLQRELEQIKLALQAELCK